MGHTNNKIDIIQNFEEININEVSVDWEKNLFQKIEYKKRYNNNTFYVVIVGLLVVNILTIGFVTFNKKTNNISMLERNEVLNNELLIGSK
jgi:hypothetical protein